ncbi:MAG TPA: hypothetical protein VF590_07255 [Isosphaeraceae bacterium]
MANHKAEIFENRAVVLDGEEFEDCTFRNCTLIYKGGEAPKLVNNYLEGCAWQFQEAAERTVNFLKGLYHGLGQEGRVLIEATFQNIRAQV